MHPEAITSEQRKIFDKFKNFPEYYLAGGTALALQIGHRLSIDFDFFYRKELPPQLFPKIKKVFKDFNVEIIVNNPEQLTVNVNEINLTFVKYSFSPIFKLKIYKAIKLLSVPEIAAAKAYSLGRRATYKDYVDLYFILSKKYVLLPEIIKIAEKKYKRNFDPRLFLEQLIYLEDIQEEAIHFFKKGVTKIETKDFFQREVKKIKLIKQ